MMYSTLKPYLNFLLTQILLCVLIVSASLASSFTGKVVKVTDGDTIQVMHNGSAEKIRLDGIDCPEKKQAFGQKAKEFTADLVAGQIVTVEIKTKDRYGRTVGEVILADGRSLNRELVKAGFAWHYKKYSSDPTLDQLEREAKGSARGLWRDPSPVAPWDWRKGQRASSHEPEQKPSINGLVATAGAEIHGNPESGVYHQSQCSYYNCKNCVAGFSSSNEAVSAGYRACKKCN